MAAACDPREGGGAAILTQRVTNVRNSAIKEASEQRAAEEKHSHFSRPFRAPMAGKHSDTPPPPEVCSGRPVTVPWTNSAAG